MSLLIVKLIFTCGVCGLAACVLGLTSAAHEYKMGQIAASWLLALSLVGLFAAALWAIWAGGV